MGKVISIGTREVVQDDETEEETTPMENFEAWQETQVAALLDLTDDVADAEDLQSMKTAGALIVALVSSWPDG